ncbi:hypothetical protein PAAG_05537 [Paracoccidioides lutzii Pb01]|uniref:Uncharacterized protein n=1 Tax=Paracoccidioides lutzii (strain ATCC MYA-826 / Pb01) TaxID=502779 RepID=C1H444_PARBA|nr:hypothetical protein PAAG_05537 [Paracoccidioides lutzii Pb01]EEH34488.2 hypothetical protein PAAG_05537 [Paracoccidioides lutzii Pb01]
MQLELENNREKCKALELELQLEKLQAAWAANNYNNIATANSPVSRDTAWNPQIGSKLQYNLYDPDNRVGKAISQFKEDIKNIHNTKDSTSQEGYMTSTALANEKMDDIHSYFNKFHAALIKLEMLKMSSPENLILDIFYSDLSTTWRNYVQKNVEEAQISKYTAVVLNVISIMKEIHS